MAFTFNDNSAKFELELDASNFERNAAKAERSFTVFAQNTSDKILTVAQDFKNYLLNDLALNAIKGGFEKSFEFLASYATECKRLVGLADDLNAPVDAISKLGAVAQESGLELDDLAAAFDALDFDAAATQLELDPDQYADQGDAFAAVVDALAEIPDEAKKAQVALDLFGATAGNISPLLDGTAGSARGMIDAAREAGLLTSAENARSAAEFADALEKLKQVATGLGNVVARAVLPAFQEAATMATELFAALNRLGGGASDASLELAQVAANAEKARKEGERLRELDAGKFDFVTDLAGQGELTAEKFDLASQAVKELQERYGDLGLTCDEATRSIEAAADAQERFNAASQARRRAELETLIAAKEEEERDLGAQAQEKLDAYDGFGKQAAALPRAALSFATGGAVKSVSDKWQEEIDALGEKRLAARKELFDLRKELEKLDAEGNAGNEQTESEPTAPEPPTGNAIPTEPTAPRSEPVAGASHPFAPFAPTTSPVKARSDDGAAGLIAALESAFKRESQTTTQNALDDARKKESEYRAALDARIVEERSKGKAQEDSALIADLEARKSESLAREEERVAAIKEAQNAKIEEQAAKLEPSEKNAKAQDADEQRLQRTFDSIEEAAAAYKAILEDALKTAENDDERAALQSKLDRLPELIETRKQDAQEEFDDERRVKELQAQEEWAAGLEPDDYFQESYKAAEDVVKGTQATFSAFDASQLAQAGLDERAIQEARRQTAILEDLRAYMRNGFAATFA